MSTRPQRRRAPTGFARECGSDPHAALTRNKFFKFRRRALILPRVSLLGRRGSATWACRA
eukprot:5996035-Prymnesium_polylepis.1